MGKQSVGLCIMLLALVFGAPLRAQNGPTGTSDSEHEKRSLAVHLLRIIGTAEGRYEDDHGVYAPWAILVDGPEFPWGKTLHLNEGPVVTPGVNPQLANLHFSKGSEILPGWRLRLDLTDDGKGYDVLLEDMTDKACGYAALTDERGLIRQSKAINCPI